MDSTNLAKAEKHLYLLLRRSDPVEALRDLTRAQHQLDELQRELILQARSEHHAWSTIGAVCGVTAQAVQQRFARRSAEAAEAAD